MKAANIGAAIALAAAILCPAQQAESQRYLETPVAQGGPRLIVAPARVDHVSRFIGNQGQYYEQKPAHTLALGGLAGGVVGFIGGAALGTLLSGSEGGDDDLAVPILAASLGTVLGIPLGTHLANGSRGRLGHGIAASGVALLAGLAALSLMDSDGGAPVVGVAIPIAMITGSVVAEQRTTR